jgi:carboxypeptidase family protein
MSNRKTHKSVTAALILAAACFAAPSLSRAAAPIRLSGAIGGIVTNTLGIPQMGASVVLLDRQERVYEKTLTDERGEFRFAGLFPDLYSIRVSLATFIPALKKDILVQPGMRSMLSVNLNTLFSSIQIAYPPPENGSLMTDDWKWMLRTAAATRPVLRFTGDALGKDPSQSSHASLFSDTRGVLKLSAGDGPLITGVGNEADMGTAFALATSVFGNNQLEVSGNLGYGSQTGVPVAAIRTAYSRGTGEGPEVSVTMRQLFLPGHGGVVAMGSESSLPMLRSVSASLDDHTQLTDDVSLQYGFTMDSVSFGDHLNYFSPYARLVYSLGDSSTLALAYTSGNARPDLAGAAGQDSDLQRDLSTVGLFPRISLLGGRSQIQRGNELELTYTRKVGSRTYELSGYKESVTNAALTLTGPGGLLSSDDLLPDLFTGNAIFNAGHYQGAGYSAAVTQNLGERVSATLMYGTMNGLTADRGEILSGSPDELRQMIRSGRRQAATARIMATVPGSGTHVIASYQWSGDPRWVMPGRLYTTQSLRPMPGLNVYFRQPLPVFSALPWRMEATADLRNLLAEGYLPLGSPNGQQVVLVQNPRGFRGGLSFIF